MYEFPTTLDAFIACPSSYVIPMDNLTLTMESIIHCNILFPNHEGHASYRDTYNTIKPIHEDIYQYWYKYMQMFRYPGIFLPMMEKAPTFDESYVIDSLHPEIHRIKDKVSSWKYRSSHRYNDLQQYLALIGCYSVRGRLVWGMTLKGLPFRKNISCLLENHISYILDNREECIEVV